MRTSNTLPTSAANPPVLAGDRYGERRPLHEWIPWLDDLAPFAPRAVEAELLRIADRPRLLVPERRAILRLLERVVRLEAVAPDEAASCSFPVLGREGSSIDGALLHAVAKPGSRAGGCPVELAFPGERRMLSLLDPSSGAMVFPSPLRSTSPICELVGDSCGAAFALAVEASRRGLAVPRDVVISAAIEDGPDGLELRPVSGCDRKRRILERERPGCRFFYLAAPGERVEPSASIELIPLEASRFEQLVAALLPQAEASMEALFRDVQEAEVHFDSQQYPVAQACWERILPRLPEPDGRETGEALRWRLTALARLGAIELHAGQPEAAAGLFRQASDLAQRSPGLSRLVVDDVQLQVASANLDRFRPDEAASILTPLTADWRRRLAADDEGPERRELLLSCLGGMRRLHLLRGEADRAVEIQRELLSWSPASERARSLADLGECLRRDGRRDEAAVALAQAGHALPQIPLETYRAQTAAFVAFYQGRLALDTWEARPSLEELDSLRAALPSRSAARWRLELLARHLRLREGDPAAADELLAPPDPESSELGQWNAALGLIVGALISPPFADRLFRAAAERLEGLAAACERYPSLESMRLLFVRTIAANEDPVEVANSLLARSAY